MCVARQRRSLGLLWGGLVLMVLALAGCGDEYGDLVSRCQGGPKGLGEDGLGDTFRRLREQPDPEALPALRAVLDAGLDVRAGWHAEAALALCALDTPEAREVLETYVLTPNFGVSTALWWAWRSDVAPDLRDRFLGEYVFRDLASDLRLRLEVRSEMVDAVQRLYVHVEARNVSESAYRIPIQSIYVGKMLQFRRADGGFVRTLERAVYDREGPPPPVALAPGASYGWDLEAEVCRNPVPKAERRRRTLHWYDPETEVLVEVREEAGPQSEFDVGDVGYDMGQPGAFDVFAWTDCSGRARVGHPEGPPPLWRGRALSNAVRITSLPPPQDPERER